MKRVDLSDASVVAFDPGESTGMVAVVGGELIASVTVTMEQLLIFLNPGQMRFTRPRIYVVESFVLYPSSASSLTFDAMIPAQAIGVIRAIAYLNGAEVVFQAASEAKNFVDDDRLSHYGWRLGDRHQRDAARHAVYYLAKQAIKEKSDASSGGRPDPKKER